MESADPSEMRISDADRERVADLLRLAAGDGRIDLDELDVRLEAAFGAKTYGDLVPVTRDLAAFAPDLRRLHSAAAVGPRPQTYAPGTPSTWARSVGVLSSTTREGIWDVGESHAVLALLGHVRIDLRRAQFPASGRVTISVTNLLGTVEVIVPYGTRIHVDGTAVLGSFAEQRSRFPARLGETSPVVHVTGAAALGTVQVGRVETPEDTRSRLEIDRSA